eukprot:1126236-Lingulodinium_polyedra.AAC.1
MRAARAAMGPQRRAAVQAVIQAAGVVGLPEGLARRAIENWTAISVWHQSAEEVEFAPWAALVDAGQ